jgi:hypothetical protein
MRYLAILFLLCSPVFGADNEFQLTNSDKEVTIFESKDPGKNYYGASISKIFVAATLLVKQHGVLSPEQYKLMHAMITVSSNSAWRTLQKDIGDGDHNAGRIAVHDFTQSMGYTNTRGFWGWLGTTHGNEVNCSELIRFMTDTYKNRYKGAHILWNIMLQTKTGKSKGLKYIPKMPTAHKTGTYHGKTTHPQTKQRYTAQVHHHILSFKHKETQYTACVLSDDGSDEVVARKVQDMFRHISNGEIK